MATTRERKPISEKTRAEDERLREELRNADIGKFKQMFKRLMPVVTSTKKKSGVH